MHGERRVATSNSVPTGMYNGCMDTRTRLVEATQDLIWERGYSAVSPKDIQAKARAGQGSMYHHFSGKQELAVAALERNAESMRADVDALLAEPGTAIDRLERYLRRQRDSLRGCRMGRMTYDADVLDTPELLSPVSETLAWLVDTIAAVVEQGREAGEIRADVQPTAVASAVAAVVQGGYVLARAQQDPGVFDTAIEGATSMLHGMVVE